MFIWPDPENRTSMVFKKGRRDEINRKSIITPFRNNTHAGTKMNPPCPLSDELRAFVRSKEAKNPREKLVIVKKNRIRTALMIFLLMNLPLQEFPEKISTFNTHIMPEEIATDGSRFYIIEGFSVYIYSLDNFSLIATFGKKGEGPGEFKDRPQLHVRGSGILVNSLSKVSFYTKTCRVNC